MSRPIILHAERGPAMSSPERVQLEQYWFHAQSANRRSSCGSCQKFYQAAPVEALLDEIMTQATDMREYWNGSTNMRAMEDALEHIDLMACSIQKALTRARQG